VDEEKIYDEKSFKNTKPRMKFNKLTKKEEIDLTATSNESLKKDLACEYCSKTGHTKEKCWMFLGSRNHCG